MVTIKLLYILLWSCFTYSSFASDDQKLISKLLARVKDIQDSRLRIQRSTNDHIHLNVAANSVKKPKRGVLKSILNGMLLKERLRTRSKLVNGINVYSPHLQIPRTVRSSYKITHNTNELDNAYATFNAVPYKILPSSNSNVESERISKCKNKATTSCENLDSSFENYPSTLDSVIRQNVQPIPIALSNFKIPPSQLVPNDNARQFIPPKNVITSTHFVDYIMQRNITQIPPCALNDSESASINEFHTTDEPFSADETSLIPETTDSAVVIPAPPVYFPLNPPDKNNLPENTLSEADMSNSFSDNSESSNNLPCPQTPNLHDESEKKPIVIPEAPSYLPLNPPNTSFYPTVTWFSNESQKDELSVDSANTEMSDFSPCHQSTSNIRPIEDEQPSSPINPTDSTVVIPNPPVYIPLNPPDLTLSIEYVSNTILDNSESLGSLPCPHNTVSHEESIGNFPIDIPEAPTLMPLNPPTYNEHSFIPETPTSMPLNEISPTDSTVIIPNPPNYIPLVPPSNINLPEYTEGEENILSYFLDDSDSTSLSPCPQMTSSNDESLQNTPIIIPEAPALMPLNPPNINFEPSNISFNNENVLSIPSADYIPLNPPDNLPGNILTDKDTSNTFSDDSVSSSPLPCSQNTLSNDESIENIPIIIPEGPSLIPLNPPNTFIQPTGIPFENEVNEDILGDPSANNVISDFLPCSDSSPSNMVPTKDEVTFISETPVLTPLNPIGPTDSNVVIPHPPDYIPLNPPDNNNLLGNILTDKDTSNTFSDDSVSSSPLPCLQNTLSNDESIENIPIIIPEGPSLIPLNPPNTFIQPTGIPFENEVNEDILGDPSPHNVISDFLPCSHSSPSNMVPTKDEVTFISETPVLTPLNPIGPTDSNVVIPHPPDYIPLNPPDNNNLLGNILTDKDTSNTFSDDSVSSSPLPCSQNTLSNDESIENIPIIIPEGPSLIPLNPPNTFIQPTGIPFDNEVNENVLGDPSANNVISDFLPCSDSSPSNMEPTEDEHSFISETPALTPLNPISPTDSTVVIPDPPFYIPLNPPDNISPENTLTEEDTLSDNSEPCPQLTLSPKESIENIPIDQVPTRHEEDPKHSSENIPELPPCVVETPSDGIMKNAFEPKKCKEKTQIFIPASEVKQSSPRRLKTRKVWIKGPLPSEFKGFQTPLLMKKTKKIRILKKHN